LLSLVALRVIQVAAFDSAIPNRQAIRLATHVFAGLRPDRLDPGWRRHCAGARRQLHAAGLGVRPDRRRALSASVAYAVSLPAFLSFTLPCLLPAIAYLFWGGDSRRGWGWFGLILLGALSGGLAGQPADRARVAATFPEPGVDRAPAAGANAATSSTKSWPAKLSSAVAPKANCVKFRPAWKAVAQRSLELDAANQALSKSEARLALALRPVSWAYGTGTCKPTRSITPRFRSCSAWSRNT
jgi:hypothetical protein